MTNDYSDYPESIAHIKSNKTGNAKDWTPRDAIIDVLRDIDSGKLDVDAVIVCYRVVNKHGTYSTRFRNAAPDIHSTLGMMELVKMSIMGIDSDEG